MHALVHVFTRGKPTSTDLEEIMAPYDEGLQVEPYPDVEYTPEQIRELREDYTLAPEVSDEELLHLVVGGDLRKSSDGNWHSWTTYNPNSEWDYWVVGGRWHLSLPGDQNMARFKDLDYSARREAARAKATEATDNYDSESSGGLTRDALVHAAVNSVGVPAAIVDLDGKWHEGDLGIFAPLSDPGAVAWSKAYWEFANALPEDAWVTVVDIHI